uniref:Dynein axonemal intermediate chain 7 n=1 Tax=Halisarca dujardinii TaxID=2583056 RepID=A0A9F1U417_HALDU|nr:dynein axonemal intermediate chain 7 [Halisarca dujardinii]
MPPKKLTKEEKAKLKREEEERKRIEEEEQKQKEEAERLKREEEERREEEEQAKLKALEDARFEGESAVLTASLASLVDELEQWSTRRREEQLWQRYLTCDPLPELEDEAAVNSFLSLWDMEEDWTSLDWLLEGIHGAEKFLDKLSSALESTALHQPTSMGKRKSLQRAVDRLQGITEDKVHKCTSRIFQHTDQYIDAETGNLILERSNKNFSFCLWGNLSKNPRVRSFSFPEQGVVVDIPKTLVLADIVVRLCIPATDPLTPLCRTSKAKSRPPSKDLMDQVEEREKPGDSPEDIVGEDQHEGKPLEEGGTAGDKTTAGRQEETATGDPNAVEEGPPKPTPGEGGGGENGTDAPEQGKDSTSSEQPATSPEKVCDGDGDGDGDVGLMLEEGEVDMRAMMVVGPLMRFDLLRLPAQPKTSGQWSMQPVTQGGLGVFPYPLDARPATQNQQPQQKEGGNQQLGAPPPATPASGTGPPVKITARLPRQYIQPQEPTVARWDSTHSHWTTNSVLGVDVNREENTFSCQVPTCSGLALLVHRHWNLPFSSWSLVPLPSTGGRDGEGGGGGGLLLTLTGPHLEVKINIKNDQCRLLPQPIPPRGEDEGEGETPTPPLNDIADQWVSTRELVKRLQWFGVNVFPSEDAVKYVQTPNKSWTSEDGVYLHMAMLSSAYAYCHSRWNSSPSSSSSLAPADCLKRNQFVMNCAEMGEANPSNEPHWSVVVGGFRSCRLLMSEVDQEFSLQPKEGCEVHPDLYNALTHNSPPAVLDVLQATPPVQISTVQRWLILTRVLRFSGGPDQPHTPGPPPLSRMTAAAK